MRFLFKCFTKYVWITWAIFVVVCIMHSDLRMFQKTSKCLIVIIMIICYIYMALFWVLKALYMKEGNLLKHHVRSNHLDDATAAILRQNAHHTPAYWGRGDRVMKPISVWGWLGAYDGQRPMGKFGQDAGVTPLLFFEEHRHPGIFNDHKESGPRFNVSTEGRCFWQYSVPVTILGN